MSVRGGDRAEAAVVAEILLITAAIVGAAAVYAIFHEGGGQEAPAALGMNEDGAVASGTKSFTVASAMPVLGWGEVAFLLGGTVLVYDSSLSTDGTYCVVVSGTACVVTGLWDGTRNIGAGHQVRVHHTGLAGKTLIVRQNELNSILYSKVLG